MKKIFALLLALVLVAGLVPVDVHAAVCADDAHVWFTNGANIGRCSICYSECLHEDTFVNVGNCEKPGAYITEKCNECGKVLSTTPVSGAHTFVSGTCTVCGAAENVECDHTWDNISGKCSKCYVEHDHKIETVYGFCTDPKAYNTQFCKGCGKTFGQEKVSGQHNIVDGKCTRCTYEVDEDCEHEWDWTTGKCTKCQADCAHEESEVVYGKCDDPNAHNTTRCAECHKVQGTEPVSGAHTMKDGKCIVCGYEVDEDCEHEWDWTTGFCTKCGAKCEHAKTEVVHGKCDDPKAHNTTRCAECHKVISTEPVSGEHTMKDGKCTVCGYEEDKDCVHEWDWTTGFCKKCGAACEHGKTEVVYGNCVDPNKYETTRCADCHKVLGVTPVSGKHDFDADGVCKKCGYKEDPNCQHEWDRVTGICKKCGKKCEHETTKWTYQDCIRGKYNTHMCVTCLKVLDITDVPGYHTFQDGICIRCGAKDPNYVPPTTPDEDLDDVPKTGDNAVVIMTAMTGVALLSAAVYVFDKKRRAC